MTDQTAHSISDAPADPLAGGRVLRDRYVITGRICTASMGPVYRAVDRYRAALPEMQQQVALTVVHQGECSDSTLQQLRRELHRGQSLSHRNIIKIFELDRDGDIVFFTMELLDGESLASVMKRMRPAPLRRQQAWELIHQLGAALEHAHERDVVHGDLSPRNIMITRDGELRILDFGTAQRFVRIGSRPGEPAFVPVSGTAAYASCELLEGRAADPRDDLYALACICYELLAGVHPFDSRPATIARNFGVRPLRPTGLSRRQWKTLEAGLSWHRAGRSYDVRTWLQRLTQERVDRSRMTALHALSPAPPQKSRPAARAAACVAAVALALLGIAELRPPSGQKALDAAASEVEQRIGGPAAGPAAAADARGVAEAGVDAAPGASPADAAAVDGPTLDSGADARPSRSAVNSLPFTVSVENGPVRSGERFVEVRVQRNRLSKNDSFTWWTEPATAKQDVDYVPQAKATQTFLAGRRSTRFYVKLLPDSSRARRDYFYVDVAQPGTAHSRTTVTRTPVWLPLPREQLQARR